MENTVNELLKKFPELAKLIILGEFRSFACYDKHLDCIRVQIKDCSFTEHRKSKFFTILQENHVDTVNHVGFNIKGVGFLFEKLGLPKHGIIKLSEILDAIVKVYPDEVVQSIKDEFDDLLKGDKQLEVEVDLPLAA